MLRMTALALALLVLSSACGHYGPPVRAKTPAAVEQPPAPAGPEEEPEETEQP